MKISASFLSIQEPIKENINKLTKTAIDYLHLDIMDGIFVKNKTWDMDEIKDIINDNKPFDIHLMVKDVYAYIDAFKLLKPAFLTFHYEIEHDIMEVIRYVKNLGISVGLSIKPNTDIQEIIPFLPFIDLVLVMSVEPGEGGQSFLEQSVNKIEKLADYRDSHQLAFQIEVDGGINQDTITKIKQADIAVVGSYITNGNYEERIATLKSKIK